MRTPEDAQLITDAVAGLAGPLHDSLDRGRLVAHEHYDQHGMDGSGYAKGRTDLTRDHARRHLETLPDLGGWEVAQKGSGRLNLRHGLMKMRVLHGTPMDATPAPGRNQARIDFYRNPQADLYGVTASHLVAVWINHVKTGELAVRIVRPIREWRYGRRPQIDIDFVLPRSAEDYGDWQFVPNDDGLMLPFFLDDDQREEGENGGA